MCSVKDGGPGDAGGIRTGDVLLRAGARDLRSIAGLYAAIDDAADRRRIELELLRGAEEHRVAVGLGDAPTPMRRRPPPPGAPPAASTQSDHADSAVAASDTEAWAMPIIDGVDARLPQRSRGTAATLTLRPTKAIVARAIAETLEARPCSHEPASAVA